VKIPDFLLNELSYGTQSIMLIGYLAKKKWKISGMGLKMMHAK